MQQSIAELPAAVDLGPVSRTELDSFYALRGYRPAWDIGGDDAAKRTLAFLDSIDALVTYHGIFKETYQFDVMRKLILSKDEADKHALEFLISANLLHLAHDLHGDTVDLNGLYTGWTYARPKEDMAALLAAAVASQTLASFFEKLAPQTKSYADLARALETYKDLGSKGPWPTVSPGPPLKLQDSGPRVVALNARLNAEGYESSSPSPQPDQFDEPLERALKSYQLRNGLSPDGHLGPSTLESLNTPLSVRINQIRANMERMRHLPDDFPGMRYSLVNIPAFSVEIVDQGALVYRGIVIDGKPDRQTPFIKSQISSMQINPSWNVPLSIARKDILPKLQKDPHYLEKLGIVITGRDQDPTGAQIDWKHLDPDHFSYQLRQNPGDLNSLGQLKFNFANPFDVYMHGTPHQELFGKAERDFSSGCVRLEDPVRVAEILLAHNKEKGGWDDKRITAAIDEGKSTSVLLAQKMPIYFLYWTVFTDDDGQIEFRKDIYGFDDLLISRMRDKDDGPKG